MINLDLYATGFNAHSQLSLRLPNSPPADLHRFTRLISLPRAQPLYAGWSDALVILDSRLHLLGHHGHSLSTTAVSLEDGEGCEVPHDDPARLRFFGDHNGIVGAVDPATGKLWQFGTADSDSGYQSFATLCPVLPNDNFLQLAFSPIVAAVAVSASSLTAAAMRNAPGSPVSHVLEFPSPAAFERWYADPAEPAYRPAAHRSLGGPVRELVAGACFFVALTEDGVVHTWGDARYPSCLGREIGGGDTAGGAVGGLQPAGTPGMVDALGGVRIKKVVAGGGWMAGALSEDGALYLWGMGAPGDASEGGGKAIAALKSQPEYSEDVRLVSVGGEADILDVSIGSGHVAVLAEGDRVFVAGKARNGQLGLGERMGDFVTEWTEVEDLRGRGVRNVLCGDLCTFAVGMLPE